MNIKERLFWMATVILVILFAQQKSSKVDNLEFLVTTYQLESNIQNSQILDFSQQLSVSRDNSYKNGFEAGKTQASIVLMNKDSLYNYTDGYHAAISQLGEVNLEDKNSSEEFLLELLVETFEMGRDSGQEYLGIISDLIAERYSE
jgi:hypothetical protein|tara:strand:+ start:25 stop:462 length:438 start_codon:yes stop_codon:yes gene_type:complete